jgi:CubicO group peptidase (beta-lactamase class C family)
VAAVKCSASGVALASALTWFASAARTGGRDPAHEAAAFLQDLRRSRDVPALSAAVAVRGRIVLAQGVGIADLENAVPATADSVYNIGSISKANTAVAVMQLVERGKVDLEDPIQRFVPAFPEKGYTVTVRHLLTHRSGIRHYRTVEFPGTPGDENVKPYRSLEESISLFKDDPLLYKPGERSSYSSFAVNLLQGVIETASGLPFEEYMKKQVWGPAGMASTAFDVPERVVARRARSYRVVDGRVTNAPYGDLTYKFASGGMISTAPDLVRLGLHLNRGTLLRPATAELMYDAHMEPVMGHPDRPPRAGAVQPLLWDVSTDDHGRRVVSRDGSVKEFNGCLVNYPREDVVAAVLYNAAGPPTCDAARGLARFFLPDPANR